MASIELQSLTKRYADGTHAVRDVSLRIDDGEFMILVGPSGCGKSTALRMVAGLEPITAGEVRIDGSVVNSLAPKDRDIAMVFQNYALYPHMVVRKNMGFALRMAGMGKAAIGERVDTAARMLDLMEQLERRPGQLSGGQRQRVAMGRAIVREPKAFLMDEPLSNLDAKLRVHMRTELTRLHAQLRTTTIYVTHDQTEAMTLGDRIAVMRDGEVQQVGTPADVYAHPANVFVAGFIGSPPMNLLEVPRHDLAVRTPFGELQLEPIGDTAATPSGDLVLGVRPEHLADARLVDRTELERRVVVQGRVSLVERMGSHNLAHLEVDGPGEHAVTARLGASLEIDAGDPLRLAVALHDLHVFDAATGAALLYRIARPAAVGSSA